MTKGLFITFEGGEGAGKSTQIKLLADYLEKKGKNIVLTREPGGTPGADEIRALLTTGDANRWDKKTELFLFMAARSNHLVKKIWPAMEKGDIVISDRFFDSSLAYQCYGYGYDADFYQESQMLYRCVAGDFMPDLTLLLDIDPEIGIHRSATRAGENIEQRFEKKGIAFHQNIRNGYLQLAKTYPNRYKIINANQSVEMVQNDIAQVVDTYIKNA